MAEHLNIQNFGPITSVELEIKRFMVLIGKQASGKSTVAKLLSIFRDIDFIMADSPSHLKFFSNYGIHNYLRPDTAFSYKSDLYSIDYSDGKWSITQSSAFIGLIDSEKKRIRRSLETYGVNNEKIVPDTPEMESFVQNLFSGAWKSMSRILREQIYIPADRILTSIISETPFSYNKLGLPLCLSNFIARFEIAKVNLKSLPISITPLVYKYEDNKNKIFHSDSSSVLLAESSSGIQALVPLQMVVKYMTGNQARNLAFIVEEPELNMYPSGQKTIVKFLVNECNSGLKHDLFVTTHSPYVLSSLNNFLFAHETKIKHPSKESEINEIVSLDSQIDPKEFNAYFFSDGTSKQIFDEKIGLISANLLDVVSEDIQGEYDRIMEIYRMKA